MGEIDWASLKQQAEDATRPLPDGDYPVVVTKAELKKASTGADMIVAHLTVTGGALQGRIVFNNFVFSPEKAFALKMWFDALAAFGLNDAFFAQGPSLEQVAAALVNRTAITTVGTREWQGRQLNECKSFKVGGVAGVPAGVPSVAANIPVPAAASAASTSMPPVPAVSSSVPPVPNVPTVPSAPPVANF